MTVPEEEVVTGMAVLNEVLVVFKKRRIYAISGKARITWVSVSSHNPNSNDRCRMHCTKASLPPLTG